MYTICKQFRFEAAHHLKGLPDGHKCGRPHGHSYKVELTLQSGTVDDIGFVIDFGDLKPFKDYIDTELDHQDLNQAVDFQTSAELLARHLFHVALGFWPDLVISVKVWETAKAWAEYRV